MLSVDIHAIHGDFKLAATLPAWEGTTLLVGPNGAGKSTLLKVILGELAPIRGTISLGGRTLFRAGDAVSGVDVRTEERRLGYVPQSYALFPHMSVYANVAFGLRDIGRGARRRAVLELLGELGLTALADRKSGSLSGGESQRVALARALASRPRALLLDEPLAALDAETREGTRQFLAEWLRSAALPSLVVSHDLADVEALGGRIAVLESGQIVDVGGLEELRERSASRFISQFLGARAGPPPSR